MQTCRPLWINITRGFAANSPGSGRPVPIPVARQSQIVTPSLTRSYVIHAFGLLSFKIPPATCYALGSSLLLLGCGPPLTSVGAIRLRFEWLPEGSSASSSVSRLVPVGAVKEARGVSGGVVMGRPTTLLEFVAAMLGTCPDIKGGLVSTPVCDADTDEFELDRAGDPARGLTKEAVTVGGDGAVSEPTESQCL